MSAAERAELTIVFVRAQCERVTAREWTEYLDALGTRFSELHREDMDEQAARAGCFDGPGGCE